MKIKLLVQAVIPAAALSLTQCETLDQPANYSVPKTKKKGVATQLPAAPSYGAPLTVQTSQGRVTIREGGRYVTSFTAARPNIEKTRWYAEQEQIVVKSRGNHGPATVQLFNSRTGQVLGSVMAYQAANGPAWARSMAE